MLIWQASYFSIMKHTGKIREFIWKQHPFGIMIVYTIGVKAFVSLHYGHFRWSIRHINSCTCTSFRAILQGKKQGCISLRMSKSRFVIRKQIYFVPLLKSKNALLIQMIHNWGGFFGSYLKPHTLDTWSEGFLYYGSKRSEYSHQ